MRMTYKDQNCVTFSFPPFSSFPIIPSALSRYMENNASDLSTAFGSLYGSPCCSSDGRSGG